MKILIFLVVVYLLFKFLKKLLWLLMILAIIFVLATKAKAQTSDSVKTEYSDYKQVMSTINYSDCKPIQSKVDFVNYKSNQPKNEYAGYKPNYVGVYDKQTYKVRLNPIDEYYMRQRNKKKLGAVVTSCAIILIVDLLKKNHKL